MKFKFEIHIKTKSWQHRLICTNVAFASKCDSRQECNSNLCEVDIKSVLKSLLECFVFLRHKHFCLRNM